MKSFSRVGLLETPWTAAYQAPPSMGFSRQEYWSGVPLPSLDHNMIQLNLNTPIRMCPNPQGRSSAILDLVGSNQFLSCPTAMSFFLRLWPAHFPPVSLPPVSEHRAAVEGEGISPGSGGGGVQVCTSILSSWMMGKFLNIPAS